jgi:iron complex outermembrane receptor protein
MHFSRTALAIAVGVAFPHSPLAYAEDGEATLGEMVVTATKTAKIASEAPATVTVITAQEIESKNAHRADEALSGAPGVFVRGLAGEQPNTWQNQVTLRGIPGYYRTGVLVDGIAINNAFSGGVNMSLIPVDDIQQIEVVPGPFSSLYGGAGMAGVVNIITKAPERRQISVRGDAGSHNFRNIEAGYRNRISDTLGFGLSLGHKQSDGFASDYVTKTTSGAGGTVVSGWEKTTTTTGAPTYIVGDKGKEAWQQDNVGAKLFLNISPLSKLTLDAAYLTHHTKDGQGNSYLTSNGSTFTGGTANIDGNAATLRATDFQNATSGEDLTRYVAAYETRFADDYKLKASLGYQNNHYWYTSVTANATNISGPGTLSDIPNEKIDGDVQISFPVGKSHYLVFGTSLNDSTLEKKVYSLANWRNEDNKGALGDWANGNSQLLAAYIQDEIAVTDRLTVYGGARYDRWSTDGTIYLNGAETSYSSRSRSAVSPKASAVYRLDQGTIIKGAIGKAFRAPNLSDMYSTFGTSTIYWSNPDLNPEKATTAELGTEHEFATGTLLRATLYQSRLTDLIYSSTTGSNRYKFNAGKAEAKGVDLEARQKFMHGLTAFFNATYVTTTITENTIRPTSVGKQIPLQARKLFNLGIEGSQGPWSGSVIASYVGKMYGADDNSDVVNDVPGSYDPYYTLNAKLAYRFDKALTAAISINNLADRDYFLGTSRADGRTIYVGLGYKY